MKRKNIFKEVFWMVLFILYLGFSTLAFRDIKVYVLQTFKQHLNVLASVILPLFFGMILELPNLKEKIKSKIHFNWTKFIIQGVPAFLLATPYLFTYFLQINTFLYVSLYNHKASDYMIFMSSLWFGKILIQCWENKEVSPVENENK